MHCSHAPVNHTGDVATHINSALEAFIQEWCLDREATDKLRDHTPSVQFEIIRRNLPRNVRNPSAVVNARIRNSRARPPPDSPPVHLNGPVLDAREERRAAYAETEPGAHQLQLGKPTVHGPVGEPHLMSDTESVSVLHSERSPREASDHVSPWADWD